MMDNRCKGNSSLNSKSVNDSSEMFDQESWEWCWVSEYVRIKSHSACAVRETGV
jgi:hypothetical protein